MTKRSVRIGIGLAAALAAAAPALAGAQSTAGGAEVTFTKDIVPILQRSCQVCHRQGEMAPMSLVTYQEVRPWARSIRNRVVNREMPPWHIDKNIGLQSFKDDPSLSDEEIAMVAAWVDNGAPRGDAADMPPPVDFPDASEWQIGEPDLVVRYPTYAMPAEGPDLFGALYTDLDLDEDRYIRAIQTRPGRRSVAARRAPRALVRRASGRGADARGGRRRHPGGAVPRGVRVREERGDLPRGLRAAAGGGPQDASPTITSTR